MQVGLLWFDDDKRRTPQQKLDLAAGRYEERFGRLPNLCHVHPEEVFVHPSIRILGNASVLRGHFWVGRDEEADERRARRRKSA